MAQHFRGLGSKLRRDEIVRRNANLVRANPSLLEVVTGGGRTFSDKLIAGRRAAVRRAYWAAFYDGTLAALAVVVAVVTLFTYY